MVGRMRKLLAIVFSALFLTTLAACGDDGDDDQEAGSGSASAPEDEGGGGGDFCEQAEVLADDDTLDELDFDDPEEFEVALGILEDFADEAPGEIEDDLDRMVEAFAAVGEAVEEAGDDPEAQAEIFEEIEDEFADIEEVGERIEEFVQEECDVDLSDEADDTTDTTDSGDDGEDTSLEDFADDVEACEDGDMAVCDQLFLETPVGSEAEEVGRTCGGEGDETTAGQCEELFG